MDFNFKSCLLFLVLLFKCFNPCFQSRVCKTKYVQKNLASTFHLYLASSIYFYRNSFLKTYFVFILLFKNTYKVHFHLALFTLFSGGQSRAVYRDILYLECGFEKKRVGCRNPDKASFLITKN